MSVQTDSMTVQDVLTSLGFADPLVAARQQAQMILLGRLSRYEAEVRQMEEKWGVSLSEMERRYNEVGSEDAETDDDYLMWRWYAEAADSVRSKLLVVA